jgi:chromosome segregation ATPase
VISGIIIALLTAAAGIGVAYTLKAQLVASAGSEVSALLKEINDITANLEELIKYAPAYVGKKQLQNIEQQLTQETTQLQKEKERLKEVETKLESAQRLVEEKESQQHETKAMQESDEQKLRDLLASYTQISDEAMNLEKRLAASLKNLETIIAEVKMTEDQKAVLTTLLNTLTEGGGQLRELITEYQMVKERLELLQQQHHDLEEEYTKLVEQQLGE